MSFHNDEFFKNPFFSSPFFGEPFFEEEEFFKDQPYFPDGLESTSNIFVGEDETNYGFSDGAEFGKASPLFVVSSNGDEYKIKSLFVNKSGGGSAFKVWEDEIPLDGNITTINIQFEGFSDDCVYEWVEASKRYELTTVNPLLSEFFGGKLGLYIGTTYSFGIQPKKTKRKKKAD